MAKEKAPEKEETKGLLIGKFESGKVKVTTPDGEVYSLETLPNTWVTLLPKEYQDEARG